MTSKYYTVDQEYPNDLDSPLYIVAYFSRIRKTVSPSLT
jgi:hypothetical protein